MTSSEAVKIVRSVLGRGVPVSVEPGAAPIEELTAFRQKLVSKWNF